MSDGRPCFLTICASYSCYSPEEMPAITRLAAGRCPLHRWRLPASVEVEVEVRVGRGLGQGPGHAAGVDEELVAVGGEGRERGPVGDRAPVQVPVAGAYQRNDRNPAVVRQA